MNRIPPQTACLIVLLAVVVVVVGPGTAFAHVGAGPTHDLLHGLEHPFTGIDHVCAMIAVGLWAAQRGGRAFWLVPLAFVLVMTLGGVFGMYGVRIPFVEQGIVLSVIVLGVLVAAAARLRLPASVFIVGLFALVHGQAHGAEIPASASGTTYALGFVVATICLHATGISFGLVAQRLQSSQLVRLAGAAIAACGLYLGIR